MLKTHDLIEEDHWPIGEDQEPAAWNQMTLRKIEHLVDVVPACNRHESDSDHRVDFPDRGFRLGQQVEKVNVGETVRCGHISAVRKLMLKHINADNVVVYPTAHQGPRPRSTTVIDQGAEFAR